MTRAEILNCLTDRPCDYCRFHESGRCERWDCVFEEKPDDVEDCEDCISRHAVLDTLDNTDKFMDEERTVETYKALLKECYDVLPSVTPKVAECEDAISRQATVERLCKVAEFMNEKRNGLGSPYVMAALFIQDNKDEFPSVTPKQKIGKWIYTKAVSTGEIMWSECSVCGEGEHGCARRMKFCPECGARMEGAE